MNTKSCKIHWIPWYSIDFIAFHKILWISLHSIGFYGFHWIPHDSMDSIGFYAKLLEIQNSKKYRNFLLYFICFFSRWNAIFRTPPSYIRIITDFGVRGANRPHMCADSMDFIGFPLYFICFCNGLWGPAKIKHNVNVLQNGLNHACQKPL